MTPSETIVRQWLPVARLAAKRVGNQFHCTDQERRDLLDMLPAVLWLAVRDGCLEPDTSPALAVTIVCRRLVGGSVGFHGHKFWRPGSQKIILTSGRRFISRGPVRQLQDESECDKAPEPPAPPEVRSDLDEVLIAVAKAAGLSELEELALLARVQGVRFVDLGQFIGLGRSAVTEAARRAYRKCARSEKVMEILT